MILMIMMMIPVLVMWILITGNVQYSNKLYRGGHWVLSNTAIKAANNIFVISRSLVRSETRPDLTRKQSGRTKKFPLKE